MSYWPLFRNIGLPLLLVASFSSACDEDPVANRFEGALEGHDAACPASLPKTLDSGHYEGFEAAGQTRSFYLQVPPDLTTPRPLLLVFNGTGGDGISSFENMKLQTFVDAGFVVLAPDSNGNGALWPSWDAMHQNGEDQSQNPDLIYTDALLDCVAARLPLDPLRLYAAGHSAGGIMTNYWLRNRSQLFAGGIVGSSVYDLTEPTPPVAMDPVSVVVTWGGDNDEYSGDSEGSVAVPEVNFVEQAAIASQAYESAPGNHQIACEGNELGHAWISALNPFFVEFLLAHPKGSAQNPDWTFVEPGVADATCTESAATFVPVVEVTCVPGSTAQCFDYCQFAADCAVENGTVSPVLGPQLTAMGFAGDYLAECAGCVSFCDEDAAVGELEDTDVLQCFADAFDAATCGPGVAGALPFIDAINACCADKTSSRVCQRLCTTIVENSIVKQLVPICDALVPASP